MGIRSVKNAGKCTMKGTCRRRIHTLSNNQILRIHIMALKSLVYSTKRLTIKKILLMDKKFTKKLIFAFRDYFTENIFKVL
jgi:hypothetical protein